MSMASTQQFLDDAKSWLDLTEARYVAAKDAYEKAKKAYEQAQARLSGVPSVVTTAPSRLCGSCSQLSFNDIFPKTRSTNGRWHQVGYLSNARKSQSTCQFCHFLVQACEVSHVEKSGGVAMNSSKQELPVYFRTHASTESWYAIVGITTREVCPQHVWLRFGETTPGSSYTCITYHPKQPTQQEAKNSLLLPRRRSNIEMSKGTADLGIVKSWLQICYATHGRACKAAAEKETEEIEIDLINVHTREIRRYKDKRQYIALSYVWGDGIQSSRQNRNGLQPEVHGSSQDRPQLRDARKPKELGLRLPPKLPQTIEDAISVTRSLGYHYLWVDDFCIDQENEAELRRQIEQMDLIYQKASLTIVAFDGDNMNAGLSGVSRPMTKISQPTFDLEEAQLMATHIENVWDRMASPPLWSRRGWTFQEGILSRRSLMFDRSGIVMRCKEEYFHDCMPIDTSPTRSSLFLSRKFFWENGFAMDLASMH